MKTSQKLLATCIAGALLAGLSLQAQNLDKNWDNGAGDNDWTNPVNWSGDALPFEGLGANIGDKLHVNLSGANRAVFDAADGTRVYQFIRIGDAGVAGTVGEIEVTGGTLTHDDTDQARIATGGRTGILTQSGGTVNLGGVVQVGLDAGSVGNINLRGGNLNATRNATVGGVASVSMVLGENGTGNFFLSGGTFATRTGLSLGKNDTQLGAGRFEVQGAGLANIGTLTASDDGFWVQNSLSTLAGMVDTTINPGGTLGRILVDDLGSVATGQFNDGNVTFAAGAKLDLGFIGAATPGTWTLMQWEGALFNNGLTLDPADIAAGWSFAFVDDPNVTSAGPLDTLQITLVPEPGAGVLAGLGLVFVLKRVRNRV